jgi:apolipoprotein N-acyltransferase
MQETNAGSPPVLGTQYSVLSTQHASARSPIALPYPRLIPALLTGGLLFASYFPLNCGWLAWVALVPLLSLARGGASKKRLFFCAWAGGLLFFLPALQWMRVADPAMYATWALLATYCALFVPVGVLLVRRLDRTTRLPLVVTLPAVWVALELFRAHFLTGFSWYLLGHTQHDFLPMIQVADLGGVYAVTVLVAAVNALLFEVLYARPWFRALFVLPEPARPTDRRALLAQGLAVALLLGGSLAYGEWRLAQNDFATGPKVALVQSNLPLRVKNDAWSSEPGGATGVMCRHQLALTDVAAARRPALIVWPETSWPDEWAEVARDGGESTLPLVVDGTALGDLVAMIEQRWRTDVLLGMNTTIWVSEAGRDRARERYNSAILVTGERRFGGRYDKIHRVPFGEYLPLRDWLPFMQWFSPYDFDYSIKPGENLTRFSLGDYHYGVLICYEDTVGYLARRYARPDGGMPAADFLLNTSNDGWFDGTAEHDQHLAICRFRAVEARRSVGRSVNMGISAVVDPNGRVLAPQQTEDVQTRDVTARVWEVGPGAADLPAGRWGDFKKVAGVLIASVPIDHRVSPYAYLGDWLPWLGWLVVGAGLVVGSVRGRRRAAVAAN